MFVLPLTLLISTPAGAEPCYGWSQPNQLDGTHLSVEWDDLLSQQEAMDQLAVAERAWARYADWGFVPPVGSPSVTFRRDPLSRAGFTDTTTCAGQEHARMFVYEEAVRVGITSEVTAHELFHAVQYAYQPSNGYLGNYVIWPWWSEGTATWATLRAEEFGPELGSADINRYLGLGHLALHQTALAQVDPARVGHLYGTALLAVHLEDVAGPDAIPATFEAVVGQAGTAAWFPDVIESMELDWNDLWHRYLARLPTLDVPLDPTLLDRPPVASRPRSIPSSYDTTRSKSPPVESLGWAIHRFDAAIGAPGQVLEVVFSGEPGPRWHAVLVRTAGPQLGSAAQEWVAVETDAAGSGVGRIAFEGDGPVYLVVSPELRDAKGGFPYTWSADFAGDEVPVDQNGCAHGAGITPWLVLLAGLYRRRRSHAR